MGLTSADARIVGQGTTSAEAVQAWIERKARAYAPHFGPQGQYVPPPASLGQAIVDECRRYPQQVVNHDYAAAQIVHETAAWQSVYARERNNPGGIGAINGNEDLALTFPSVAAGVQAHVAHLLVYAVGDGPWVRADPRADKVQAAGWFGAAETWRGLNGKWAYPGTSYGQKIAELAADLIDFANNGSWNVNEPQVIRRVLPKTASNHPGHLMTWEYITVHNTGNPRPGADALMHAAYLESLARAGATEPSWHYTVDEDRIVQHLEDNWAGYHASDGGGNGNFRSLGYELVEVGNLDRVIQNAAWHIARKLHARGYGLDRLRQHHDWARDKKNCPRLLRANNGAGWQRLQGLIQKELDALNVPPPPPPTDYLFFPETQHGIGHGFKTFWEKNGGLLIFGYPLTEEIDEDGMTVQYFERAVFEFHPSNPDEYKVLLRRLGADALERKQAA